MNLGQTLIKLRKEKGIGQKELAAELNLSVSTVSNHEKGVHSPDYETLCKIADYYGVTTDFILGRTDYRFDPKTLNECMTEDYTVMDYVDTMYSLNVRKRESVMLYAMFINSTQESGQD